MAPVYIVFSAPCSSPLFTLADLDSVKISFEHFSVIEFMWSLNVSFVSSIIPRYFRICTCVRGWEFKYIIMSFRSFRFRLDIKIVFDFCSLKCNLLSLAHAAIFVSSMLAMFSASVTVLPLIARIKSSANAIALVRCVKLRFRGEL